MFYSKSTGGFYHAKIHGDAIPDDVVEITAKYYGELLTAQSPPNNKKIAADESGYPIAIDQPTPVRTTARLLAEVANKRWQIETGGIVVNGRAIATDTESQAKINAVYVSMSSGLITDTQWKADDGEFIFVTMDNLTPVVQAVAAHVRACFVAEQAHVTAITALKTQDELETYDINIGWPPAS